MNTQRPRRHLIIVGAGITGLAAAWEASADPGLRVTVLDAGSCAGGKIRTSDLELDDGTRMTVDEGADAFLARVPDAVRLCHELGLDDELTQPAATRAKVLAGGELHFLPDETVLGVPLDPDALVAAGILSSQGAARAVAELDLPATLPAPDGDVAIGPFLSERYGDELVERIVGPLIGGINAGDIDRLSLDAVTPQLAEAAADGGSLSRALLGRRRADPPTGPVFRALLRGTGRLIEVLTEALVDRGVTIRTEARVSDVRARAHAGEGEGAGQWQVRLTDSDHRTDADHRTDLLADLVLVCAPANEAAQMLRSVSPTAAAELDQIEYSSVTLVTLVYRADQVPIDLDASGFLVPRSEGLLLTAASWGSSKWAHWDDGRHVVLRVSAGRTGDDRQLTMDDDELLAGLRADLHATMGIEDPPVATRVSRWPNGFAQYTVGHLDRVDRIESALRADAPTVAVAGAAYRGLGLPACIRQGRNAVIDLRSR